MSWFVDRKTGFTRHPRRGVQPSITVTIPFEISEKFDELDIGDEASEKVAVEVEVEGDDVPPPATSFEAMRFSAKSLNDNIRRCNYSKPTPIQSHAIPAAILGRDLMACAHTGSGKTAAFCFPIINAIFLHKRRTRITPAAAAAAFPLALILAPTRELSCQVLHTSHTVSFQNPHSLQIFLSPSVMK